MFSLPKLLKEHAGRWVGYAGDERIGIADSGEKASTPGEVSLIGT
jgi:hypothetical protein